MEALPAADVVEAGFGCMERFGFSAVEQGRVMRKSIRNEADLAAVKKSIGRKREPADTERLGQLCDIRKGVEHIVGTDPLAVQEFVENPPDEHPRKNTAGEDGPDRVIIGFSLKILLLTGDARNIHLALEYVVKYPR